MTAATIPSPMLVAARQHLAATAERACQDNDLLTHPVDRAVVDAVLGSAGALLGDRRAGERLAMASDQLRHHVQQGQADPQEAAIAHTLLAILHALHPIWTGRSSATWRRLTRWSRVRETARRAARHWCSRR